MLAIRKLTGKMRLKSSRPNAMSWISALSAMADHDGVADLADADLGVMGFSSAVFFCGAFRAISAISIWPAASIRRFTAPPAIRSLPIRSCFSFRLKLAWSTSSFFNSKKALSDRGRFSDRSRTANWKPSSCNWALVFRR